MLCSEYVAGWRSIWSIDVNLFFGRFFFVRIAHLTLGYYDSNMSAVVLWLNGEDVENVFLTLRVASSDQQSVQLVVKNQCHKQMNR